MPEELRRQVAEELNVVGLAALGDAADLVDVTVKANFRQLGRRFAQRTPAVAAAVAAADPAELAAALRAGAATVDVDGEQVTLTPDDVVVTETPRTGWAVAADAGATVALDLTITPELRRAGLAREAVRSIQESRKASGLEVSDRVEVWWQADEAVAAAEGADISGALREHGEAVANEVLAVSFVEGPPPTDIAPHRAPELGLTWFLRVAGE
jgi:isoleucyl-tRNA synthetase